MVTIDKAIIARYKHSGETFEILVDCDNALLLKQGQQLDMKDILADEKVFSDAKKGLLASETKMKVVFGTDDIFEIARQIIKKGDVQLTADHKARLLLQKRKRILELIHGTGVDPKSGLPHPMTRIELAFDEAKIRIDEHRDETQQVEEIIKKLRVILPISFEKKKISVIIPAQYTGKAYGTIKGFGKMLREEWRNNGDWFGVLEVAAAKQAELFEVVGKLTQGEAEATEMP